MNINFKFFKQQKGVFMIGRFFNISPIRYLRFKKIMKRKKRIKEKIIAKSKIRTIEEENNSLSSKISTCQSPEILYDAIHKNNEVIRSLRKRM